MNPTATETPNASLDSEPRRPGAQEQDALFAQLQPDRLRWNNLDYWVVGWMVVMHVG